MSEQSPTPENQLFSREQVIAAFRPFVASGITNPYDLVLDDPVVDAAYSMLFAWDEMASKRARESSDPEVRYAYKFERTTILVDAGFSDPEFLEEIANDWLDQDLAEVEADGFSALAAQIQARIDEINARLTLK
jgi:hypothetical protein